MPAYTAPAPVERKVSVATVTVYLACTGGLAILNAVSADASLIAPLPDVLETILLPLVPTAITWFAAYRAKHTPRPDLEA